MCQQDPQRPVQPYRDDPAVAAYYKAPSPEPGHSKVSDAQIYQAWEQAYFNYKRAETEMVQGEQMAMQESYYASQLDMQNQQMALQKQLQEQQIKAQQELQAMQAQMQQSQAEAANKLEIQRLNFEKESALSTADSKRALEQSQKAADQQTAFEVGRANKQRKNAGGAMASKGTKTLQIGLNTGSATNSTAGLAIPS